MFLTRDGAHVVLPWRPDLAALIPHAKEFVHGGKKLLLFPNGREEAKVCRNVGIPVPAPILTRYDWAGTMPWDIQKTTAALLSESPRAYILSTMGTGKTRSAIFAADYLYNSAGIGPWLIAAPLSTLTLVWEQELFRVLPQARTLILHGPRAKRIERLNDRSARFFVINHHGLPLLLKELIARQFGGIIIDELAILRNRSTELWKAAKMLLETQSVKFAWGLTGSPTPQAPTDAWAQVRLLTPARVPRTMTMFRDQTMRQVSTFKWVPRPEANSIVFQAMQPSVRYSRDDIAELPPTSYVDREVKLGAEAAKAYKMLFDKMRMLTQKGEAITAANEGVLQSKLLQVALGYIYTDKRDIYRLPDNTRLEALREIVDECDRKAIVFVPFIHALEGVSEFLRKCGHSVATVSGATSRGLRDKIFRSFQDDADPRFVVAHPQCMSHGLTLTSANIIIWYGPTNSLEIYEQANARITRPGQTSKTLIAHLSGTPVERATYARLRTRAKMQGMLLELFAAQDLDF